VPALLIVALVILMALTGAGVRGRIHLPGSRAKASRPGTDPQE
jgi:predicted small lipoprotein YifL